MKLLLSDAGAAVLTLVVIVVAVAAIALITYIIYRFLHPKMKDGKDLPSEEDLTKEALDRVLQPIEDDETAKQVSDYQDPDEE